MGLIFSTSCAYLIGSLPLERWFLGNIYRRKGKTKFYGIMIGIIKGIIATLTALVIGKWLAASLAAIFVVFGSMYSIFLGFRGDGEIAVATGALFILSPLLFLVGVAVFFLSLIVTRYYDLSTMVTTVVVMIIAIFFVNHSFVWIGTIFLGVLVLFNRKINWNEIKNSWKIPRRFKR